ncbi:hypothetical protein CJU89_0910 [Yarrowia sp. B02]|nr:hypothetical protein CJU89_0910 [Yarrowia sp. B02]
MKLTTLALAATASAAPLGLGDLQKALSDKLHKVLPHDMPRIMGLDKLTVSVPGANTAPPSAEEAARVARTLVHRESLTTLVTVNGDGTPEGYVEYYADCGHDGSPVMLNVHIGTGFRNIAAGSDATLSVRVGDHPVTESTNPWYPGGIVKSAAGSPRVSLRGHFVDLSADEAQAVEACFLDRHPDAKWWLPGNKVHSSHWVKFEVASLHMVGGFGDRAFIGEIDGDLYRSAKVLGHGEGVVMSDAEFEAHHGMTKAEMKSEMEFKAHHGMTKAEMKAEYGEMSEDDLFKAHHGGMSQEEFMEHHSGEEYEAKKGDVKHHKGKHHGKHHGMKGKHHGNHPEVKLTQEQLLKIHAALSDDPEFMEKHAKNADVASSDVKHPVSEDHGKNLTPEQLLKVHAALSDDPEAFMKAHVNNNLL